MMMVTLAVASPAHSDEAQCKDVLHKCDDALKAEINLNTTLKQANQDQQQLIDTLNTEIKDEQIWKPLAIGGAAVVIVETLLLVLKK